MTAANLNRLLSLVKYLANLSYVEGLDAFRSLLENDPDDVTLAFLKKALTRLEGRERGGIAFVIAEYYRQKGDLESLKSLFATDDPFVKSSVLNALQGDPGTNPAMGPGIIELALEGANHVAPEVRTHACSVFQDQCAWGTDVSDARVPLQALLKDQNDRVRHQASYAVGNLAKKRYNMTAHVAQLRRNLKHEGLYVREASAWALGQLSRHKHDIGAAVPELIWLLAKPEDYNEPRKKAASALIHHAKKSADAGNQVKKAVQGVHLDSQIKEIKKFLEQLAKLK